MTNCFYAGIDPSISNTGLVILDSKMNVVHQINGKITSKSNYDIENYINQAKYIVSFLADKNISAIGYENYSFNSTHRAYSLAEYNGILKSEILRVCNKNTTLISPMQLKKFATGNGHADKNIVMQKAKEECPLFDKSTSSDICDAYFLAKYAFYKNNQQLAVTLENGNSLLRTRLEISAK